MLWAADLASACRWNGRVSFVRDFSSFSSVFSRRRQVLGESALRARQRTRCLTPVHGEIPARATLESGDLPRMESRHYFRLWPNHPE